MKAFYKEQRRIAEESRHRMLSEETKELKAKWQEAIKSAALKGKDPSQVVLHVEERPHRSALDQLEIKGLKLIAEEVPSGYDWEYHESWGGGYNIRHFNGWFPNLKDSSF